VVFTVPLTTGVSLPGLWVGLEETACRTTGVRIGSIAIVECIAILIRSFVRISFAAVKLLKTELRMGTGRQISAARDIFSAFARNQMQSRE